MSSNLLEPTQLLSSAETPWIDLLQQIAAPLPSLQEDKTIILNGVLTCSDHGSPSLSLSHNLKERCRQESVIHPLKSRARDQRKRFWAAWSKRKNAERFEDFASKFQRAEIATSFIQVFNFLPGVILIT